MPSLLLHAAGAMSDIACGSARSSCSIADVHLGARKNVHVWNLHAWALRQHAPTRSACIERLQQCHMLDSMAL